QRESGIGAGRRSMNLLVLDESLELALLIGRIAPLRGWQPHFIGSLHEMELAVQAHGRPALTGVNLQAPLTAGGGGRGWGGWGWGAARRWGVGGGRGAEEAAPARGGVQWLERPGGETE